MLLSVLDNCGKLDAELERLLMHSWWEHERKSSWRLLPTLELPNDELLLAGKYCFIQTGCWPHMLHI